jgi:hypothetical protein
MVTEVLAYPLNDACRVGGFTRTKAYELIGAGKLEARKIGNKTIITAESLKSYLANLPPAQIGRHAEAV